MAAPAEEVTGRLEALELSEPEHRPQCVPFNPEGRFAWLWDTFDEIPRYLFRITTPQSDGTTDAVWARSKDDIRGQNSHRDIFAETNPHLVANELLIHLRWWGKPNYPDNMISWTSSLLFALQYAFFRNKSAKVTSRLDEISLCVIDTSAFQKSVFVRDLDLIKAYKQYNDGLESLWGIRSSKYYFGEYLSQGPLKIENKCQIVSIKHVIDNGLVQLQPRFQKSIDDLEVGWANPVVSFRGEFYSVESSWTEVAPKDMSVALSIARLFGPLWSLPMAACFLALRPHRLEEGALWHSLTPYFTAEELQVCSPSDFGKFAPDTLPEVHHTRKIFEVMYTRSRFMHIEEGVRNADSTLRTAWTGLIKSSSQSGLDTPTAKFCLEKLAGQMYEISGLIERFTEALGDRADPCKG